jgi:uncharacterized repeat protein (TIGR02059 family)
MLTITDIFKIMKKIGLLFLCFILLSDCKREESTFIPIIPELVTCEIQNTTPDVIEMTYDLALANIIPAPSAFTVMVGSGFEPKHVKSVAISGSKVLVTFAPAVYYGEGVFVSYAKPKSNPLQTPSGGEAATFTNCHVNNNILHDLEIVKSDILNAAPTKLLIVYNFYLANIAPAPSAFTVMVNSIARTVNTVTIPAYGTVVELTLASAVVYGDIVTVAYTKPGSNPIQSTQGVQAASITAQPVNNEVAAIPVYISSVVENATPDILEMTYSLPLNNSSLYDSSAFIVMVNSVARIVNLVCSYNTKVRLYLASSIVYGDIVTVAYTKPIKNPLRTATGGQAESFTAQPVTNNVKPVSP